MTGRAARAALAALLLLAPGPPARGAETVPAEVAGRRYAVPPALLRQDGVPPPPGGFTQALTLQPVWPGLRPPPPGHGLSYADGLLDILVQDLSAATRVEGLAALPDPRARFLRLWRDSTADQFALPPGFALSSLAPVAGAAPPGLLRLGPVPGAEEEIGVFADAPPGRLSTLMTCRAGLSCQLWWMEQDSAVQVTFAARLLPDWAAIRSGTAALLGALRRP